MKGPGPKLHLEEARAMGFKPHDKVRVTRDDDAIVYTIMWFSRVSKSKPLRAWLKGPRWYPRTGWGYSYGYRMVMLKHLKLAPPIILTVLKPQLREIAGRL